MTEFRSLLSPDETARATRFVYQKHGDAFTVARGGLRRILAQACKIEPRDVAFTYGPAGKPQLSADINTTTALEFNLTHSGGQAALAICHRHPLGIDIEQIKPIDLAIARRFFSAAENQAINATEGDKAEAFFRCWTRKEAVLKALGCGLNRDTRSFSVAIDPPSVGQLAVSGIEATDHEDMAWSLFDFDPGIGYLGAVAVKAAGLDISLTRHRITNWDADIASI